MKNLLPVFALIISCSTSFAQYRNVMEASGRRVILQDGKQTTETGVVISGVVEDQSGAAISDAKLTLTNKIRVDVTKTKADAAGAFNFQNILPGKYTLYAEAKNFAAADISVTVVNAPLTTLKLKLNIAAQEDEVTISSSGKSEEESASVDRNADRLNFDENLIKNLPSQNIVGTMASFLSPSAQGAEGVSVVVDGVESSAADLPAGALRRARINRNPYSAEFRRQGKARIEIATQETSLKRYHGSVGLFTRNSVFDARNPFALTRPELDRKLFEGNFSGPILKKRVGFFVSGERLLNDETAVVNARLLSGPFVANIFTPQRRTNFLGRIDVRAGEKHSITGMYNFRDEFERNRGVGGLKLAAQGYSSSERLHRLQFSDRMILSPRLLNDVRIVVDRSVTRLGSFPTASAIVVIGAFTDGAAQKFQYQRETTLRIQDIATYATGKHSLKFGAEFRPRRIKIIDASNFGGTYEFSNLNQFASAAPFVYRVNQGSPELAFSQNEVYLFMQDDIKIRPNFSFTPGVRYSWQSNLRDRNNFAPRFGFAWAPLSGKTVIRGGAGIFYERLPESVISKALLYDGSRIREMVIQQPSFPSSTVAGQLLQRPPSVVRVAPDARAPYITQASVSVEREVWKRSLLTVEFQTTRGNKLLRSRNINAPLPGSNLRLDPNLFNINQVESSARMRGNALSVAWRGRLGKRISGMAQYSYSRTSDNTNGIFGLPANNYDLRSEWGRSEFDQRHRVSVVGTLDLPWGIRLGTFTTLASGMPYDITTGFDNNGDSVANDRPSGVRRNAGNGPNLARVDLRFTKALKAPRLLDRKRDHQSQNLEINIDFFNLLNRTNFNNFIGAQSSPFFGKANSAQAARAIQLSARYRF